MAFTHQYRFAVAEIVEKLIPRAISIVLLLSIVGALLDQIWLISQRILFQIIYVGSYLFLAFLTIIPSILFIFYKDKNIL